MATESEILATVTAQASAIADVQTTVNSISSAIDNLPAGTDLQPIADALAVNDSAIDNLKASADAALAKIPGNV